MNTPIGPGQSLTLTIGDAYHLPCQSNFNTLVAGTPLYVQLDSFDQQGSSYGAIMELREDNNVFGPVYATAP